MPYITRQSRVIGALPGLHAGDSLGASVEFKTHAWIADTYPRGGGELRHITGGGPFNWPAGHATDDTDMTRGVLLAYRDILFDANLHHGSKPEDVAVHAGKHFLEWLRGD